MACQPGVDKNDTKRGPFKLVILRNRLTPIDVDNVRSASSHSLDQLYIVSEFVMAFFTFSITVIVQCAIFYFYCYFLLIVFHFES